MSDYDIALVDGNEGKELRSSSSFRSRSCTPLSFSGFKVFIDGAFSPSLGGAISGVFFDDSRTCFSSFGRRCQTSSALFCKALPMHEGCLNVISLGVNHCCFVSDCSKLIFFITEDRSVPREISALDGDIKFWALSRNCFFDWIRRTENSQGHREAVASLR